MDNAKPVLRSKTMWFNLAAIGLGAAESVAQTGVLGSHGDTALAVLGIGNMILRALTTQPLAR